MEYGIRETDKITGKVRTIDILKKTARGYIMTTKRFKSLAGAKRWINKRLAEIANSTLDCEYEIFEITY